MSGADKRKPAKIIHTALVVARAEGDTDGVEGEQRNPISNLCKIFAPRGDKKATQHERRKATQTVSAPSLSLSSPERERERERERDRDRDRETERENRERERVREIVHG